MIWVIAYINISQLCLLERDMSKNPMYKEMESYVPTIRVLKKQLKGKDEFYEVPLLLNYGFFRIPITWAVNTDLLEKIKLDINCIAHWVKDPVKGIVKARMEFNDDDHTYRSRELNHLDVPIATATDQNIKDLIEIAKAETTYSSKEIDNLKPGSIVTLTGYPFEGMEAEIIKIDKKRKKVWVCLDIAMTHGREVEVSFDNVFYSIYKGQGNYDENYKNPKEESIEDWKQNRKKPNHYEGTEDSL